MRVPPRSHSDVKAAKAKWQDAALSALRGRGLDSLQRRTLDGLLRGPLGFEVDKTNNQPFSCTRGRGVFPDPHLPWDICQAVAVPTPKMANQHILQELEGGASAIEVCLSPDGQFGISVPDSNALQQLLQGVNLEIAGMVLQPAKQNIEFAKMLIQYWKTTGTELRKISVNFGISPAGLQLETGAIMSASKAVQLAQWAVENAPGVSTFCLSGDLIHNAG
ncbi:hypothetical protein MNBD_ALPHA06-1694, partial [hydrothermal vent metagenome]